jgi:DNA-binding response OmpR family regulator
MADAGRKRILIVEDEVKIAGMLARYFEGEGYEVHAEHLGMAAIEDASRQRPDLVILDLRLPDIGGYQVSQELRKLYHRVELPILVLTAMDRPIDRVRGFAHGADAYLPKPFELADVGETVSVLLGQTDAGATTTDLGFASE